MATATATASTRSSGVQPYATITITGGTADDRLTLSDIAASHASLTWDEVTGRLTQSDSTPRTYFIGTQDTAGKDAYAEFPSGTVQLHDNDGDDTPALDRGNTTSKLIFGDGADVIIGQDNKDGSYSGRFVIRGANYGFNFYSYTNLCEANAKIVCHGEIFLSGRNNARFQVQNSNSESELVVVEAGDNIPVDPFAANDATGTTPKLNLAPGFGGSLRIYGLGAAFRFNLAGTGTMSIPEIITSSALLPTLYVSNSNHDDLIVSGLRPGVVGTDGVSQMRFLSADRTTDFALTLQDFRGSRTDTDMLLGCDDANCSVESNQNVTARLIDPAGNDLTGKIRLQHASYSVNYQSGTTPPTITIDDDGETEEESSASSLTNRVLDKVWAKRENARQDFEDSTHSTVSAATPGAPQLSAWVWGREYVVDQDVDLSLGHTDGEQTIVLSMAEDANITTADPADVPTAAATLDDVYDMLADWAYTNNAEIPGSVASGTLTLTSNNIVFALGGTLMVTSGSVTLPCAATLAAGTKIMAIAVTGTSTVNSGVTVTAPVTDTNGTTSSVAVTANDDTYVAIFSSTGTQRGSTWEATSDGDTNTFAISAANSEDDMIIVGARAGYVSSVQHFDAASGGSFSYDFTGLVQQVQANGDTYDATDLSTNVAITFDTSDFADPQCRIEVGDVSVSARTAWSEVEAALTTADGLKYLAAGGMGATLIETFNGDFLVLPDGQMQVKRAAMGDVNATIQASVQRPDGEIVDDANGSVQLIGGLTLAAVQEAILEDYDIDPDTAGLQSLGGLMVRAETAVEEIQTAVEALPLVGDFLDGEIESGVDVQAALRILLAAVVGQTTVSESGGNTTLTMKRVDSAATDVWETTVNSAGSRTASGSA